MKTCKFIKVQTRRLAALSLVLITIVSCGIWPPTPEKCKERWSVERIERITKVKIPDYEVTRFAYGPSGIDYVDTIFIEFESEPSDEMFKKIDELMTTDADSRWFTEDSIHYKFHTWWGNGIVPAPEGEKEDDDTVFDLYISKGEKAGVIVYGSW